MLKGFRVAVSSSSVFCFYVTVRSCMLNECVLFFPPVQLSLRDNDLISLPKEIGELAQLKELHIQGNRLTVLPPELGTDHTPNTQHFLYNCNFQHLFSF